METDISHIKEDYKFEKGETPARNIFWIIMAGILLVALTGLLGDNGILNNAIIASPNYSVEYQKYLRIEKSSELTVELKNPQDESVLSINNDYFSGIKISAINPEPITMETYENEVHYRFKTGKNGKITFYLDPIKKGEQALDLTINGKKETLSQFTYF